MNIAWISDAPEVAEFVLLAIWVGVLHFTVTMVLASPFLWFGADRARWNAIDLLALFLPYDIWATCMFFEPRSLETAFYLSLAITVASAIRVAMGHRPHQYLFSAILLVLVCGVGLGLYFFGHHWPALFPLDYN